MTPGQIAYLAWCKRVYKKGGATAPLWTELAPIIRETWQEAADAVIADHESRPTIPGLETHKVIEQIVGRQLPL